MSVKAASSWQMASRFYAANEVQGAGDCGTALYYMFVAPLSWQQFSKGRIELDAHFPSCSQQCGNASRVVGRSSSSRIRSASRRVSPFSRTTGWTRATAAVPFWPSAPAQRCTCTHTSLPPFFSQGPCRMFKSRFQSCSF